MARTLSESLLWWSRRVVLDALINEMRISWEERFRRQRDYFIRRGAPLLREQGLFEAAKRKPPNSALTAATNTLDNFTDGLSVRTFDRTIPASFAAGAEQAIRDTGSVLTFDVRSPLVVEYLKTHSAEKLGRDVDATTKDRIRRLLVRGYDERWTYRRTIKEIRALYDGFNARTGAGITRMSRAELIANTELGNAYSQGALRFAAELADGGMELEKSWNPSASPCPEICAPNAAQGWIPLSAAFSSGHDAPLGHPRCRCSLSTRVKPAEMAA